MSNPRVSIITCVLNSEDTLERSIRSVVSQTYTEVEYIIIDGGSTDNSLQIIKTFHEEIDYWISEQDEGIYQAMNKGVEQASGEYLFFLNADDWFFNEKVIAEFFHKFNNEYDLVYGDSIRVYPDFKITIAHEYDHRHLRKGMAPSHQASFINSEKFRKSGGFDESFKSAGDFDLFCRLKKMMISSKHFDIPVAFVSSGGFSSRKDISIPETRNVIRKYYGFIPSTRYWIYKKVIEQWLKEILLKMGLENIYKVLLKRKMQQESDHY